MKGLICAPVAKLIKKPLKNSELVDEALYGTLIEVLEETSHFYLIKTFYNYVAYVEKCDVSIIKTDINYLQTFNGIISKHFVDVLSEPRIQSNPFISIPRGSYLKILPGKLINDFQQVELANSKQGYISKYSFKYRTKKTIVQDEDYLRKQIVANALLYLGSGYRWGGKTILGIDCSGLCSISYLLEDILIYRDAILNADILETYHLREIKKVDLKPADLIYTPGHIMMYIGDNQYIHASTITSGVSINSLNEQDENYIDILAKNISAYASVFK